MCHYSNQIQSNLSSRCNHSNNLVMHITIAAFAGQNNGQDIVTNSIQSNNFTNDNHMNDLIYNRSQNPSHISVTD